MWNPIKRWLRSGDERQQAKWDRIARSPAVMPALYVPQDKSLDEAVQEVRVTLATAALSKLYDDYRPEEWTRDGQYIGPRTDQGEVQL